MSRRIETHMIEGPAGRLEALLEEPDGQLVEAALICHPHPQHGGTMHNKVVYRMARALRRRGAVVLRFNYRGVNLSEGAYGNGDGELEDARAALAFLLARYPELPYTLAGFSFGSRVALRLGCELGSARRIIAVGFPTVYKDRSYLDGCGERRIFVQSTRDEFGPRAELEAVVASIGSPELHFVEATDHFFGGALDAFEATMESLS